MTALPLRHSYSSHTLPRPWKEHQYLLPIQSLAIRPLSGCPMPQITISTQQTAVLETLRSPQSCLARALGTKCQTMATAVIGRVIYIVDSGSNVTSISTSYSSQVRSRPVGRSSRQRSAISWPMDPEFLPGTTRMKQALSSNVLPMVRSLYAASLYFIPPNAC